MSNWKYANLLGSTSFTNLIHVNVAATSNILPKLFAGVVAISSIAKLDGDNPTPALNLKNPEPGSAIVVEVE